MPCQSCIDKLVSKLVRNHPKLDPIRARKLASKAVERVANRKVEVDPNYTQACTQGTCPPGGGSCVAVGDCGYLLCGCPDPLAHSHQVSACSYVYCHADCSKGICTSDSFCTGGTCGYDCDSGYTWNGTACVPAAVGYHYSDGLVSIQV